MIQSYFRNVHEKLNQYRPLIKEEFLDFDLISNDMGVISGKIEFIDGSILDLKELVDAEKFLYRFHFMANDKRLIKRWDTAPHHRSVKTFPFHLHTPKGIFESKPVKLNDVLDEISHILLSKLYKS